MEQPRRREVERLEQHEQQNFEKIMAALNAGKSQTGRLATSRPVVSRRVTSYGPGSSASVSAPWLTTSPAMVPSRRRMKYHPGTSSLIWR